MVIVEAQQRREITHSAAVGRHDSRRRRRVTVSRSCIDTDAKSHEARHTPLLPEYLLFLRKPPNNSTAFLGPLTPSDVCQQTFLSSRHTICRNNRSLKGTPFVLLLPTPPPILRLPSSGTLNGCKYRSNKKKRLGRATNLTASPGWWPMLCDTSQRRIAGARKGVECTLLPVSPSQRPRPPLSP